MPGYRRGAPGAEYPETQAAGVAAAEVLGEVRRHWLASQQEYYTLYFLHEFLVLICTRCSKSGYFYSLSLARYVVTLILEVINTKTFNKIVSLSIFDIPWIFFSFGILKRNHLII